MTLNFNDETYKKIEKLINEITDPSDSLKLMALLVKLWSRAYNYRQAQLHGTPMEALMAQLELDAVLGELGL